MDSPVLQDESHSPVYESTAPPETGFSTLWTPDVWRWSTPSWSAATLHCSSASRYQAYKYVNGIHRAPCDLKCLRNEGGGLLACYTVGRCGSQSGIRDEKSEQMRVGILIRPASVARDHDFRFKLCFYAFNSARLFGPTRTITGMVPSRLLSAHNYYVSFVSGKPIVMHCSDIPYLWPGGSNVVSAVSASFRRNLLFPADI